MQVIYIDTLFILNLIVNYLILLATAKIAAVHILRRRLGLGAVFGAGYAVLAVFPQWGFLAAAPMMIVSGIAMLLLVFGGRREILRLGIIFFAVSAAFGGMIYAISLATGGSGDVYLPISLKVLVISFGLCYGCFTLVFQRLGRSTGAKLVQIELTRRGKSTGLTGLIDTGNSLTDPVTGGGALVAETHAVASLFTPETVALLTGPERDRPVDLLPALQTSPDGPGFYLIPYTAVGTNTGFLLAFRPDTVRIDKKICGGISVALSPTRISDGGRYTALVNGGSL